MTMIYFFADFLYLINNPFTLRINIDKLAVFIVLLPQIDLFRYLIILFVENSLLNISVLLFSSNI